MLGIDRGGGPVRLPQENLGLGSHDSEDHCSSREGSGRSLTEPSCHLQPNHFIPVFRLYVWQGTDYGAAVEDEGERLASMVDGGVAKMEC
jgi:hypothetical protein